MSLDGMQISRGTRRKTYIDGFEAREHAFAIRLDEIPNSNGKYTSITMYGDNIFFFSSLDSLSKPDGMVTNGAVYHEGFQPVKEGKLHDMFTKQYFEGPDIEYLIPDFGYDGVTEATRVQAQNLQDRFLDVMHEKYRTLDVSDATIDAFIEAKNDMITSLRNNVHP